MTGSDARQNLLDIVWGFKTANHERGANNLPLFCLNDILKNKYKRI